MLEQAECKLNPQYATHRLIEPRLRNLTGTNQRREMIVIQAADHVHVNAGKKAFTCRSNSIVGDAVGDQFSDRSPVAVHNPTKSPFVAKNLGERERIGG